MHVALVAQHEAVRHSDSQRAKHFIEVVFHMHVESAWHALCVVYGHELMHWPMAASYVHVESALHAAAVV